MAALAGPVLALVSFVVAYLLDPVNFGERAPLAAIPACLLAVVVLLISHTVLSLQEIERASAHTDRIYEAVKDYLHVTKVGSPEDAVQYVLARLPIVREVRNTTLNIPDEIERSDERLYGTRAYEAVRPVLAEWTSKDRRWKDIGDARAVPRLRQNLDLAMRVAGRRGTGYQFRLLGRDEPQINFILLTYVDSSTEVLFNWDFRNVGQDPNVLLSRDRDIVEMFAVQFEHLWRAASPDHDRTATRSSSVK